MTGAGAVEARAAELPEPDAEALAHSRSLAGTLRWEMAAAGGRIPFRRFMELALYAPGQGYYSAGSRKLGGAGDFITAPELTPLFARCLARQCETVLRRLSEPVILEPGAGSGVMAADLLQELESRGSPPAAYWILEPSAELRQRQQELLRRRLPQWRDRISWLEALPDRPFEGLVIANEVLDALPVHRVRIEAGRVRELCVEWSGDGFRWCSEPAGEGLAGYVGQVLGTDPAGFGDGYTTEVNPDLPPFIASLSDCLARGVLLLIDYGYPRREYYHPQRRNGTLLCHYRHRVHDDPLRLVGLQDITASVDFTAVAEAGAAAGLDVRGYTTQAHFLLGCGLDELLQEVAPDSEAGLKRAREAKLLTLPAEMGERFQAMALTRGLDADLAGFRLSDHRYRL